MRAVIVGAGIGGLAASVALRRVGVETLIVERVAAIREVGAGLSIWSNAMNALRELGVEVKVMAAASVIERSEGDVLVGADGINSVIRERLHGTALPRYSGYTCCRGICRGEGVQPDHSALLVFGAGTQFGLWPCGAGQVYWFLTKNA
jgi:2-polyprenyl-6-methoxyphenol hydroxylase-like FAD-dependent oxidoreductase